MGTLELNVGDIVKKPHSGDSYAITRLLPGVSSIFILDGEITGFPGSMVGPIELAGSMTVEELHVGMVAAMGYGEENSTGLLERLLAQHRQGPVEYHWE